jgi:hypothetical protein
LMTLWTNIFFLWWVFITWQQKKMPAIHSKEFFEICQISFSMLPKHFYFFSLTYSQIWLSSLVDDGSGSFCGWNLLSKYGDFKK